LYRAGHGAQTALDIRQGTLWLLADSGRQLLASCGFQILLSPTIGIFSVIGTIHFPILTERRTGRTQLAVAPEIE
jgi:hypothetical protein